MSGARFRFRDAAGTEQELSSVEELSARVEGGEVTPETELFDAGAGGWSRAGDLPIFQFIVDELRMEGRLPQSFERDEPPPPPATPPSPPAVPPHASEGEKASRGPSPSSEYDFHIDGVEDIGASETDPGPPPAVDSEEASDEETEVESPEGVEDPRSPLEELPLTPDPFEMHLPRKATPSPPDEALPEDESETGDATPGDKASRSGSPAEEESRPPPRKPGKPKGTDDIPLHEWLLHSKEASSSADEAADEPRDSDVGGRKGFGSRTPDDDRPRRLRDLEPLAGAAPLPGEQRPLDDTGGPAPGGIPAGDQPDPVAGEPGEIRSRKPPPRKDGRGRNLLRRRDRRRSMVVSLILGGGLIIGVAIFALTMGNSEAPAGAPPGGGGPAPPPSELALELPAFPLPVDDPDELSTLLGGTGDEMAERMEALVRESLDALLDSIRLEQGLSAVPPPGWLGGAYLSAASTFDDVTEFWDGYEAFIRHLMEADEELHREAARRAWLEVMGDDGVDAPEVPDPRLDAFLDRVSERYVLVGPIRQTRYEGRLGVTGAAWELHDFLLEHEDQIEHAPALGRGISRDPILEAVPNDEATRRELDRQLDRLFIALDQTRQGVPPALGGLRTELFNRLREPV